MATTELQYNVMPCHNACNVTTLGSTPSNVEIKVTVMVIIIILGLVNNSCVLLVIIRVPHLRRQLAYLFVSNLCIIDLFATTLVLPFATVSYALHEWPFSKEFCLAEGFLSLMLIIASTTSVCSISVDRLYSIKSPMHYTANVTLERVLALILVIWIYAIVIALLPVFGWNSYSYQPSKVYCSFDLHTGRSHAAYILVFATFGFLLPSAIILLMYSCIYRVARKAVTQIAPRPPSAVTAPLHFNAHPADNVISCDTDSDHPATPPQITINGKVADAHDPGPCTSDLNRSKYKAVKTLLVIILTFFVLWGPYFVFSMKCAARHGEGCSPSTDQWTLWLGFASFMVNPIVYGIMNRSVREETTEMLKRAVSSCRGEEPEPDPINANENFFEFLERTSVAGRRDLSPSVPRPEESKSRSRINIVCGAANIQSPDEIGMSMQSCSSMC